MPYQNDDLVQDILEIITVFLLDCMLQEVEKKFPDSLKEAAEII